MRGLAEWLSSWWSYSRRCSCSHRISSHGNNGIDCIMCPCEKFQWRIMKWIY